MTMTATIALAIADEHGHKMSDAQVERWVDHVADWGDEAMSIDEFIEADNEHQLNYAGEEYVE